MSVEHSSPRCCAPDNGALHVWSALQATSSLLPPCCPASTSLLSSLHGAQVLIPYAHREMTLQNGGGPTPIDQEEFCAEKRHSQWQPLVLGPAAADNGPFWAGSEVESVTAQSHRPHVVKGIKQCTPEVKRHNSKRKTLVTTITCHHQSRSFLKKDMLLLERIKNNSYSCNF